MKMDRNINKDGRGKYALLNLRRDRVEWGAVGNEDEFFVIKLKDVGALAALAAYASVYDTIDEEWAEEIRKMSLRAGPNSPFVKNAD